MENPDPRREHRVAFALREALPTRRHAEMLFEMAVDHLGAGARVESDPDGNHRVLFVVEEGDPRRVVPWPVLTLSRNPRQVFHLEIPGLKPAPPPPPRPGKAPNLRGLGPGFLSLHEGARYVQVAYAEDGRWFETSRGGPPETLEGVLPLLAAGGGPPVERVAAFVASLDPAALGPLRILLPDPAARRAGPTGEAGLAALRAALARGAFPPGTRWIAADAVDGTAVAGGPSRDEALFAWAAEVERVRPGSVPPPPPPPPPPP
ncbi:MAG: hypothetical protein L6R43_02790, partial [Planctomycetes bacterium]|nr:hypothetical protein [Planctomycetota bacterium]